MLQATKQDDGQDAPRDTAGQFGGAPFAPLTVLVVDDNRAAAQTLGWMLEMLGHTVRLAHTGISAIEIATAEKPHLVLMDLGLPDISGHDAGRRMRALKGLEHTVFAAQTGWDSPHHRKLSKESGFEYHLVKPVEVETLRGMLALAAKIRDLLTSPLPPAGEG